MTVNFNLVCWSCGKQYGVEAPRHPQFAFEVSHLADELGLYGALDIANGRTLVFCNKECAADQRKKNGSYRIRPKKVKEYKA